MFKFVYLINTPGYTPETYNAHYANEESDNWIVGTNDFDNAIEYAKKMAAEGYGCFNLCGDFDDEMTAKIQAAVGPDVKVKNAQYAFGEEVKVEALEVFEKYGIVVVTLGITEPVALEIKSDELYTKIWLCNDQEQANEAAASLAAEGMHDIELCSWFNEERTMPVIKAVASDSLPVGTCGL